MTVSDMSDQFGKLLQGPYTTGISRAENDNYGVVRPASRVRGEREWCRRPAGQSEHELMVPDRLVDTPGFINTDEPVVVAVSETSLPRSQVQQCPGAPNTKLRARHPRQCVFLKKDTRRPWLNEDFRSESLELHADPQLVNRAPHERPDIDADDVVPPPFVPGVVGPTTI